MKRLATITMMVWLGSAAGLYAQAPVEATCSDATLTGTYGVSIAGMAPAASVQPQFPSALYPVGTNEQFIGVVRHTFDGKGTFTQVDYVKGYLSGTVLDRPGGGTYSVNPDCTGTYRIFIPGLNFPVLVVRFVIVDGGKEFRGIVITPEAAMTTANGRKMN